MSALTHTYASVVLRGNLERKQHSERKHVFPEGKIVTLTAILPDKHSEGGHGGRSALIICQWVCRGVNGPGCECRASRDLSLA